MFDPNYAPETHLQICRRCDWVGTIGESNVVWVRSEQDWVPDYTRCPACGREIIPSDGGRG